MRPVSMLSILFGPTTKEASQPYYISELRCKFTSNNSEYKYLYLCFIRPFPGRE